MGHEISRHEVLNNLIRFKDSLLEKKTKRHSGKERVYKILLNRKTGDIRFPQKIKSLEYRDGRGKKKEATPDFIQAQIVVMDLTFELQNARGQKMEMTQFDPLAWRIIRETMEVLNGRAQEVKPGELLIEEVVLQDLSSIHLSQPIEHIEDLPAWVGTLSRVDAEKRLHGRTRGTYLIRGPDLLTQALGMHFSEENHTPVHPFLLTVVEDEEKISDILLIQTEHGWTFYQDDPNLNDLLLYKYESTPLALLKDLSLVAKDPITFSI